jgi:hypothetical protein
MRATPKRPGGSAAGLQRRICHPVRDGNSWDSHGFAFGGFSTSALGLETYRRDVGGSKASLAGAGWKVKANARKHSPAGIRWRLFAFQNVAELTRGTAESGFLEGQLSDLDDLIALKRKPSI